MNLLDSALQFLSRDRLSVFLFHKVPLIADPLRPIDIDLATFEKLLDFVSERFHVIPLDEAVKGIKNGKLPKGAACITFDDGYAGWLQGAVPALERRQLHATFFITSGQFSGVPMWHERVSCAVTHASGHALNLPGFGLPALPISTRAERQTAAQRVEDLLKYQPLEVRDSLIERLEDSIGAPVGKVPRMSASDLRDLHSRGFGIGAHTVLHPILSLCDPVLAANEIGAVKEELQELIGGDIRAFAYPNGRPVADFNADHVRMVRRAGYDYAVTTQWGRANRHTPIYQIPRFTPWGPTQNYMALQMARNLATRPRLLTVPFDECQPEATVTQLPKTQQSKQPVRVMIVENGAGFGGAVIALQTLLAHLPSDQVECHVTSNLAVGQFKGLPSVISHAVISDRVYNFRPWAERVKAASLGVLAAPLLFSIGRLDDLVNRLPYLIRLLLHALQIKPAIIHGNNEPNSNREALLVAKLLGIPYIQHLRGALGASRGMPWLMAKPDAFIPVSRWLAADLLSTHVAPERVRQIYDAVDLSATRNSVTVPSLREEFGIAEGTVIVAMIGMLVPWKGQQTFIDAVKALDPSDPSTVFMIIGGTPARGEDHFASNLKSRVKLLKLDDHIVFTGQRNDIPTILPEIDIVVSASEEPEPLGLVMLEAMASGCQFVAPNHGAATEVVIDGINGFLFVPRSSESLADKLSTAIAQASNRPHIANPAQHSIQTIFSGARCANATLNLYRSIHQGITSHWKWFFPDCH